MIGSHIGIVSKMGCGSFRATGVSVFALAALTLMYVQPSGAQIDREEPGIGRDPRLSEGQIAPVLEGLGDHSRAITTGNDRAQLFFNQGLRLAYGFNHAEALRAFKEASRLDPDCAMAYWGQALVQGPNINLPMQPQAIQPAWDAARDALRLATTVTAVERDLVEALATRYSDAEDADRAGLDAAYTETMAVLAARYPKDDDVATLYAAAIMNQMPWDYWTKDGRPRPKTTEALAVLEEVMSRTPMHPGAIHYYIHAVEASADPGRAEAVADRLLTLMPGAGHMVHMPSHIYMRLGRFEDAAESNRLAALADEQYIAQCRAQGIYPLAYYPHNVHFLAWAATEAGASEKALAASRKVASKVPPGSNPGELALRQTFLAMPLYTMVRFNMWDEILAEPEPEDDTAFLKGIWHYARGRAFAGQGKLNEARMELAAIEKIRDSESIDGVTIGFSAGRTVLRIAARAVAGEIACAAGDHDLAIAEFSTAVRFQDGLRYTEPPDWHYSMRLSLGAALLEAGRDDEAETVYWADLREHPGNGWTLFGLKQALEAQEKADYAAELDAQLETAWANADVKLADSRTVAR